MIPLSLLTSEQHSWHVDSTEESQSHCNSISGIMNMLSDLQKSDHLIGDADALFDKTAVSRRKCKQLENQDARFSLRVLTEDDSDDVMGAQGLDQPTGLSPGPGNTMTTIEPSFELPRKRHGSVSSFSGGWLLSGELVTSWEKTTQLLSLFTHSRQQRSCLFTGHLSEDSSSDAEEKTFTNIQQDFSDSDNSLNEAWHQTIRPNSTFNRLAVNWHVVGSALKDQNGKRSDEKQQRVHGSDGEPVSKRHSQQTRRSPSSLSHMSDWARHTHSRKKLTFQLSLIHRRDLMEADVLDIFSGEERSENDSSTITQYVYKELIDCRRKNGLLQVKVLWPKQTSWEEASGFLRSDVVKAERERKRKRKRKRKQRQKRTGAGYDRKALRAQRRSLLHLTVSRAEPQLYPWTEPKRRGRPPSQVKDGKLGRPAQTFKRHS